MSHAIILGSRRVLGPGPLRWLRAIAWGVGLLFMVGIPAILVAGIVLVGGVLASGMPVEQTADAPGPIFLLSIVGAAVTALAAYALAVRVGEDRPARELAPGKAAPELLAGLGIGAAMMALIVGIMLVFGWVSLTPIPIRTAWRAVAMAVQSGVIEELLFRLIMLRLLWRAFGPWAALALSAFFFGAMHLSNPNSSWFAALCIMAEAGIMLAGFYILTGRLWVSIGVHAGWNFTQGWILGAAVSGTDYFAGGPMGLRPVPGVPGILSGAGFGPEASLPGLLVGTGVGAYTLWLAWQRGRFTPADEEVAEQASGEGLPSAS